MEKRSKSVALKRLTTALGAVLVCGLVAVALSSGHSALVPAFAPRGGTLARQLDETIGATVEPLDAATARSLGLASEARGVVVTSVASGGPAGRAGVRTGDVVVAIDRPVDSINDLAAALRQDGNVLTVTLKRNGQSVIVPLTVGSPGGQPALAEEEWQ